MKEVVKIGRTSCAWNTEIGSGDGETFQWPKPRKSIGQSDGKGRTAVILINEGFGEGNVDNGLIGV